VAFIRIDYPGYTGEETLERISWEQFFEAFENDKFAFLYQDTLEGGETRRFSKLIDRDSTEAKAAWSRSFEIEVTHGRSSARMPGGRGCLEVGRRVFFDDYYLHHRLHTAWLRKMLSPRRHAHARVVSRGETPELPAGEVLSQI
jgi:hypothetical protein